MAKWDRSHWITGRTAESIAAAQAAAGFPEAWRWTPQWCSGCLAVCPGTDSAGYCKLADRAELDARVARHLAECGMEATATVAAPETKTRRTRKPAAEAAVIAVPEPSSLTVSVPKAELAKALSAARRICAAQTTLPVLKTVLVETTETGLRISANNLQTGLTQEVPCEVLSRGMVCFPARDAAQVAGALPEGAVELRDEGTEVRLTAGRSDYRLPVLPAEDFPVVTLPGGEGITVSVAVLKRLLAGSLYAAQDEGDLRCVCLDLKDGRLTFTATDSKRAARAWEPVETSEERQVLIPRENLTDLGKILPDSGDVTICLAENEASFAVGNLRFTSRVVSGQFARLEKVLRKTSDHSLSFPREEMLTVLRRIRLVTGGSLAPKLRMDLSGLQITLAAQGDGGRAREDLELPGLGKDLRLAVDLRFLIEGFDGFDCEVVQFAFNQPRAGEESVRSPILLRPEGREDGLALVMPMEWEATE